MIQHNNHLAIFEREHTIEDFFTEGPGGWEEVCRAYVSLEPMPANAQRLEFVDTAQNKSVRRNLARTIWTHETKLIDTKCRMKVGDRVFHLNSVVNVDERNREIQMLVEEQG